MLTEQRFERILERLKVKKSITVAEITEDLGISESTARRDITALDKAGKLTKVFGGAGAAEHTYEMKEPTGAQKVSSPFTFSISFNVDASSSVSLSSLLIR